MILTDLFTAEQCEEAMELLGGLECPRSPGGERAGWSDYLVYGKDGDRVYWQVIHAQSSSVPPQEIELIQVVNAISQMQAACILQVAAEQTVNAANVRHYCTHGEMHNGPPYAVERLEAEEGNIPSGIATLTEEGKWVRYGKPALFQTKLEALLGALRAEIER